MPYWKAVDGSGNIYVADIHYIQMEWYLNQLKLGITEIDRITTEN